MSYPFWLAGIRLSHSILSHLNKGKTFCSALAYNHCDNLLLIKSDKKKIYQLYIYNVYIYIYILYIIYIIS